MQASAQAYLTSYRFPVEHVKTPGGQVSSKAWGRFCLFTAFFSTCFSILFCLQTQLPGGQISCSSLSDSSLCSEASEITGASFVISDRFPVEHVQTPADKHLQKPGTTFGCLLWCPEMLCQPVIVFLLNGSRLLVDKHHFQLRGTGRVSASLC